jgi:formylglycine-generating enzyme required for sulfatase activity
LKLFTCYKKVSLILALFSLFVCTNIVEAADRGIHIAVAKTVKQNTEQRVALVVGNWKYASAPLINPKNDSADIAKALRQQGFEVIYKTNVNRKKFRMAIRDFGDRINKGGVGLFYYAGHGMQVKGHNYLIPVGADITREDEITDEAVEGDLVLRKMDSANNRMNILILDACRNNPYARSFRSGGSGLARMDAPKGTLISYATSPGSVASDGTKGNSPYTWHLLQEMKKPGTTIEQMFKQVRLGVLKDTGEKQTPWEVSSLTGDFYFAGKQTQTTVTPFSKLTSNNSRKPHPPSQQIVATNNRNIPVQSKTRWTDPTTGMEFLWVPEGCFTMGNKHGEPDEAPAHKACLDGFWLGKFEVTQNQWETVIKDSHNNLSHEDDHPKANISWDDANSFIKALNALGNNHFRLPNEAEWEYSCRNGGKPAVFHDAQALDQIAWVANSTGSTQTIGGKTGNKLGFHDMIGNVGEWILDGYKPDAYETKESSHNPLVLISGKKRVIRGGGWDSTAWNSRCVSRFWHNREYKDNNLGLRLVRIK